MKVENSNDNLKPNSSRLREGFIAVVSFILGDITSKLGLALLGLIIGFALILSPFQDANGNEVEKSFIPYVLGVILIVASIALVISWLKKRKKAAEK